MSNPYQPLGPSAPAPAPAPPKKGRALTSKPAVAVGAGLLGLLIGVTGTSGSEGGATAGPGPVAATVTATRTVQAPAPEPTETAAPEPEPREFKPLVKDFKIKIKILKKQCFGSAGCLVDYRIDPEYVGTQPLPDTGTVEVTYRVTGDESGPIDNTFTVEDGQASYDKEESLTSKSPATKIKAKVTSVAYDE